MGVSVYEQQPASQAPSATSETVILCNWTQPFPAAAGIGGGRQITGMLCIANSAAAVVTSTIKCRGVPYAVTASSGAGSSNVPPAIGNTAAVTNYTQIGGSAQLFSVPASATIEQPFGFYDNSVEGYAFYVITLTAGTSSDLTVNDGYLLALLVEPYGSDV